MANQENVINGLYEMACRATWKDIDRIRHKFQPIINDAIALLKAQEPKQVFTIGYVGTSDNRYATCPGCLNRIHSKESPHYCGHCGQAVKWE